MRTQTVVGVLCAVVFFHLVSRMARANAIGKCKSQVSAFQKAPQGHTYDTFKVNSPDVCVKRCDKEEKCQSINFVIDESICELNKRSKEARPDNYVTDPRRIYTIVQFDKGGCSKSIVILNSWSFDCMYTCMYVCICMCIFSLERVMNIEISEV